MVERVAIKECQRQKMWYEWHVVRFKAFEVFSVNWMDQTKRRMFFHLPFLICRLCCEGCSKQSVFEGNSSLPSSGFLYHLVCAPAWMSFYYSIKFTILWHIYNLHIKRSLINRKVRVFLKPLSGNTNLINTHIPQVLVIRRHFREDKL